MNLSRFRDFALASALLFTLSTPLRAQTKRARPFDAVRIETRADTRASQRITIARVDLRDAAVEVRVAAGGADPDGDGPWQTTLQPLSQIAERERFEVAVNGDFFSARSTADAEGARSGYVAGKWALAIGPAATDGYIWARPTIARPALWFDAENNARIEALLDVPAGARQVVAGSDVLVRAGAVVPQSQSKFATDRHPRTAVGLADGGKTLVMVVVDGRDAERALGLSLGELARLMRELGCDDALNLDGGGSSEMIARDAETGRLRVMNAPSDGRERAIANGLGVSIRGSLRVPASANGPTMAPVKSVPQ